MYYVLENKLDEKDYIKALLNGDRWAQKLLYEDYYGKMMGICMRYAKSNEEAKDLLHDGFLKILKKISNYETNTSLSAWIGRTIVNNCIDNYRKQNVRRTEDLERAEETQVSGNNAISLCTQSELLAVIQSLSTKHQMVFNLFVIEGYTHKEISEIMDITESTSRSLLSKAKQLLREIIGEKYPGYGQQ